MTDQAGQADQPPKPDIQQILAEARAQIAGLGQKTDAQENALERGMGLKNQYDRAIEFYEKLHNQAEDIGGPARSQ